ncbi:hypothetical protein PghCCS26_49020 [Paenibacillus glycanilyticus]|uniref:Uncharacterized protein n=1 Tax=Paenibacillus glycanilyticus TaxID=126569 RepID=A0ABQ6NRM8_9BACL|nr:hypothetical protein PghCCS26_49020 [Paenibacillus glycanilyticus]
MGIFDSTRNSETAAVLDFISESKATAVSIFKQSNRFITRAYPRRFPQTVHV